VTIRPHGLSARPRHILRLGTHPPDPAAAAAAAAAARSASNCPYVQDSYIGLLLYDVDKVLAAASVENDTDLYEAQLNLLLDPRDPAVVAGARAEGTWEQTKAAARNRRAAALRERTVIVCR